MQIVPLTGKTKLVAQAQLALKIFAQLALLALAVQIVPLTDKTKLVAQVVVASCATCWQNEVSGISYCR